MNEAKINEIEVNGVVYVPKNEAHQYEVDVDGLAYVIIRTYSAGVFAGWLAEKTPHDTSYQVLLLRARRLWWWEGAASLSQMAINGTSKPDECKFPCEVDEIELYAIEIIKCTEKARKSIGEVQVWTA